MRLTFEWHVGRVGLVAAALWILQLLQQELVFSDFLIMTLEAKEVAVPVAALELLEVVLLPRLLLNTLVLVLIQK